MGRGARILSLCLGLALVTGDVPSLAQAAPPEAEIVLAQAERGKRPGIFRFLFRNRRQRLVPMPPPPQPKQARPRKKQQQTAKPRRERKERRERRERRQRAAAPAAPVVQAVEKAADAKRLFVVGDFMAGALAKGLDEAYEENPNVLIIDANNGSSGLVRDDYYDWPAALTGLVAEQKPDVLLALIGANDRQPIATASGSRDPGTEEWRAAYGGRVSAFANALAATGKPVLWAGLPPVRQNAMSRDYSAINGIIREQLEGKAPRFVETWNGFADEEGQFVAVGPDVGGQSVQLRAGDGINFTRAGQRKLAYFVEQQLDEILGGATPLLAAASAAEAEIAEPGEPVPKIGPMLPIEALRTGGTSLSATVPPSVARKGTGAMTAGGDPSLEARTEASASIDTKSGLDTSAGAASGSAAAAIVARLASASEVAPPFGRADNYEWPLRPRRQPPPPAAAAPVPAAAAAAVPPPLRAR